MCCDMIASLAVSSITFSSLFPGFIINEQGYLQQQVGRLFALGKPSRIQIECAIRLVLGSGICCCTL